MPLWEKASSTVYDMLVGHEVGHALFTPDEEMGVEVPATFLNVVEDVRIEKLSQLILQKKEIELLQFKMKKKQSKN